MTQEEKSLLLPDLCARLPYRTIVKCNTDYRHEFDEELSAMHLINFYQFEIKPYLRPMSSMTEEERKQYMDENVLDNCDEMNNIQKHHKELTNCPKNQFDEYYHQYIQLPRVHAEDYLNSIHIDYRGFIEKGLALLAPEGMYND